MKVLCTVQLMAKRTFAAQVVTPPVDAPPPVDNKDAKQQGDSAVSAAAGGGPLFGANTSSDFSFAAIAAKSNTSPGFGKGMPRIV